MMHWYGTGLTGWGYVFVILGLALAWIVAIVGSVWLTRYLSRTTRSGVQQPEQVLAARFARGELDELEYRHQLAVLRGDTSARTH